MIVYGPSDAKTKAIQEMFENGTGVIRDLSAEKKKYERMIAGLSQAERDYNQGKFCVDDKEGRNDG